MGGGDIHALAGLHERVSPKRGPGPRLGPDAPRSCSLPSLLGVQRPSSPSPGLASAPGLPWRGCWPRPSFLGTRVAVGPVGRPFNLEVRLGFRGSAGRFLPLLRRSFLLRATRPCLSSASSWVRAVLWAAAPTSRRQPPGTFLPPAPRPASLAARARGPLHTQTRVHIHTRLTCRRLKLTRSRRRSRPHRAHALSPRRPGPSSAASSSGPELPAYSSIKRLVFVLGLIRETLFLSLFP